MTAQHGERSARTAFHWALACFFLPGISMPIVWAIALWAKVERASSPRWWLALFLVAIADTAIAATILLEPSLLSLTAVEAASPDPAPPLDLFAIRSGSSSARHFLLAMVEFIPFALVCALLYFVGRRRSPRPESFALAGVLVAVLLLQDVFLLLVTSFVAGGHSTASVLTADLFGSITVIAVGAAFARSRARAAPERAGRRSSIAQTIALGLLYALGVSARVRGLLAIALNTLGLADWVSNPVSDLLAALPTTPAAAALILACILLGSISEEIVFRGPLLDWLRSWTSPASAVVASAALFALVHPHYGPLICVPFVYGVVFGWARLASGSLVAAIVLHVVINGLVVTVSYLSGEFMAGWR